MIYVALSYLNYLLFSKHKHGHGIHSPFVFDFITNVLNDRTHYVEYEEIEDLIKDLKINNHAVVLSDFGAKKSNKKTTSLSAIVKKMSVNKKYGRLLFRIVRYYKLLQILELGTCVGVSTLYLAKANSSAKIITVEGCESYAKEALKLFTKAQVRNVDQIVSSFEDVFVALPFSVFDCVFFDGNHTYEATISYFNYFVKFKHYGSIFIFDDIYWSKEMTKAWQIIQKHPEVTLSIDLYRFGIVFFTNNIFEKQHFRIRF